MKNQTPSLPVAENVQPEDELKARFGEAIKKRWSSKEEDLRADRPGMHAAHVFDFVEGIRLLISRTAIKPDDATEDLVFLTASLSDDPNAELVKTLSDFPTFSRMGAFVAHAEMRFRFLSGFEGDVRFLGLSPGNNPAWSVPLWPDLAVWPKPTEEEA